MAVSALHCPGDQIVITCGDAECRLALAYGCGYAIEYVNSGDWSVAVGPWAYLQPAVTNKYAPPTPGLPPVLSLRNVECDGVEICEGGAAVASMNGPMRMQAASLGYVSGDEARGRYVISRGQIFLQRRATESADSSRWVLVAVAASPHSPPPGSLPKRVGALTIESGGGPMRYPPVSASLEPSTGTQTGFAIEGTLILSVGRIQRVDWVGAARARKLSLSSTGMGMGEIHQKAKVGHQFVVIRIERNNVPAEEKALAQAGTNLIVNDDYNRLVLVAEPRREYPPTLQYFKGRVLELAYEVPAETRGLALKDGERTYPLHLATESRSAPAPATDSRFDSAASLPHHLLNIRAEGRSQQSTAPVCAICGKPAVGHCHLRDIDVCEEHRYFTDEQGKYGRPGAHWRCP